VSLQVSLDQVLCRGDCICSEICPQVFVLDDDGIAYVVADGAPVKPGGPDRWVEVPEGLESLVQDAARECPTEAISVRAHEAGAQVQGGGA
jgi:ferredoxin